MNGISYLLDTNIIIGLLKRQPAVLELFAARQITIDSCAYTAITRMELLSFPAISPAEIQAVEFLLSQMHYLALTGEVEDVTIDFRRAHQTKLPDSIIAATAKHYGLELLTLDKKLLNAVG